MNLSLLDYVRYRTECHRAMYENVPIMGVRIIQVVAFLFAANARKHELQRARAAHKRQTSGFLRLRNRRCVVRRSAPCAVNSGVNG